MGKKLVLAEKPSVAREIAKVLGARQPQNGYIEGPNHIVTWALGHLVTLAEPEAYGAKYRKWSLESLPMLPEKMELVVIAKTAKQFSVIRSLMSRSDVTELVIATDSGREGELVARWIMEKAGCRKPAYRLWISSQTDKAIKDGFAALKPASQYESLYKSAVCRAQADWFVGLNVTRALTCKHNAQLSAGRVQTPTLSMIIEREDEIRRFVPKDYYRITALVAPAGMNREHEHEHERQFMMIWQDKRTSNARIFDKNAADALLEKLKGKPCAVVSVKRQNKTEPPPQAYDLTELQRDANRRYSYSAKTTLSVLQGLYETHKLVTYPRTDSRYISKDVAATLNDRLKAVNKGSYARIAGAILSGGKNLTNRFVDDSKVTDHHAIIPTEQHMDMGALNNDEKRIYDLIVKRFLAVLSKPHEYEETIIAAEISGESFIARGRVTVNSGWREIYAGGVGLAGGDEAAVAGGASGAAGALGTGGASGGSTGAAGAGGTAGAYGGRDLAGAGGFVDEDDEADDDLDVLSVGVGSLRQGRGAGESGRVELPRVKAGDKLNVRSINQVASKTKPPARYTEATLLTAMEHPGKHIDDPDLKSAIENASGIGTPATRADIIEKLFDSFYVERGGKSGKEIIPTSKGRQLINLVPEDLRSAELTARWEQRLERIANRRGAVTPSSSGKSIPATPGRAASSSGKSMPATPGRAASSSFAKAASASSVKAAPTPSNSTAGASDELFIREIKDYAAKLVSAVVSSSGAFTHDNLTRDRCPECGKFLLAVNGKKGEMLVCQDRECGYRKNISIVSNAACPNCHKKLILRGEGESRVFACVCGYRERLVDFEARRESTVGKREVQSYLAEQAHTARAAGTLNSALSDQLKKLL